MNNTIVTQDEFDRYYETFEHHCQEAGITRVGRYHDFKMGCHVIELWAVANNQAYIVKKAIGDSELTYSRYPLSLIAQKLELAYGEITAKIKNGEGVELE